MSLIKTTTTLSIFCLFISTLAYAQTAEDYYNSGLDKYDQQDYKGAIQDHTKAIELSPKLAVAYHNRGHAKARLKDYRGAIQDFNKAIELNPNFDLAYYNRGLAKLLLGQKGNGCLDLSKAGELGHAKAYEAIKEGCT